MVRNFSFVLPGRLAGLACPSHAPADLAADVAELRAAGVGGLVTLMEEPLDEAVITAGGLAYLHEPIPDFGSPDPDQAFRVVRFVREVNAQGGAAALHCYAGQGRTGTLLACVLVADGASPRAAIDQVRVARPGSIETRGQAGAVEAFAHAVATRRPGW
jgi:hypothetical protein